MAYYSQNEITEHSGFVALSDCLKRYFAVHLFQSKLCSPLSGKLKHSTRFTIFLMVLLNSLKVQNFINLCYRNDDLGRGAEWHFFLTSQANGACDGSGGTFTELATKASLQNP